MNPKLQFAAKCIAVSLILYFVWGPIATVYAEIASYLATAIRSLASAGPAQVTEAKNSFLLIPMLAVLIASAGFDYAHKLKWATVFVLAFLGFDSVTVATEATRIAERVRTQSPGLTPAQSALGIAYHALVWILPFALLMIAIKWKAESIWTPSAVDERICPICGQKKVGLANHIQASHGYKEFKKWKAELARASAKSK